MFYRLLTPILNTLGLYDSKCQYLLLGCQNELNFHRYGSLLNLHIKVRKLITLEVSILPSNMPKQFHFSSLTNSTRCSMIIIGYKVVANYLANMKVESLVKNMILIFVHTYFRALHVIHRRQVINTSNI